MQLQLTCVINYSFDKPKGNIGYFFSLFLKSREVKRSDEKAVKEANMYFFIESGNDDMKNKTVDS